MIIDPVGFAAVRRTELLAEAEHERLLARVAPTGAGVRHQLAVSCVRLAAWIDSSTEQYARPAESGPVDWVPGAVRL